MLRLIVGGKQKPFNVRLFVRSKVLPYRRAIHVSWSHWIFSSCSWTFTKDGGKVKASNYEYKKRIEVRSDVRVVIQDTETRFDKIVAICVELKMSLFTLFKPKT